MQLPCISDPPFGTGLISSLWNSMTPFARKARLMVLRNEFLICYIPQPTLEARWSSGPPWRSWTAFHRIEFLLMFNMGIRLTLIGVERYLSRSFMSFILTNKAFTRNSGSLKISWNILTVIQNSQRLLWLVRWICVELRRILTLKVMFLCVWWLLTSHTRSR